MFLLPNSWFNTFWILHAYSVPSMSRSPLDLPEHRSFAPRNCLWVMARLQPPVGAGLSLSFFLLSLLFYFPALITQATNSQFFVSVFSRISRFIGTGNWRKKAVPDASLMWWGSWYADSIIRVSLPQQTLLKFRQNRLCWEGTLTVPKISHQATFTVEVMELFSSPASFISTTPVMKRGKCHTMLCSNVSSKHCIFSS